MPPRCQLLLVLVALATTACEREQAVDTGLQAPSATVAQQVGGDRVVRAETSVAAMLEATSGVRFKLEADFPEEPVHAGAVLVAPDQVRDIWHPDHKALAQRIVQSQRAAFRFNWGFFHSGRRGPLSSLPAALGMERAELDAALAFVVKEPRVNATDIVLLGQGLGAVAAWSQFRERPDLRGFALFDPPCVGGIFRSRFPMLGSETRPILVLANRKAGACPGTELDQALRAAPPSVQRVDYSALEEARAELGEWLGHLHSRPPAMEAP